MNDLVNTKKKVSFSQFSNWFTCAHKWYRDVILKEKTFEDNLIMSFGTAIHETVQLYLKTLYGKSDVDADRINMVKYFQWSLKRQIKLKKIKHTEAELNEFFEDGKNILFEFKSPENRLRYFPRDKWELLGIEDELNSSIKNNVTLTGFIDVVLRDKLTGEIRIIDIKTSNNGWTNYAKEDFTKTSQLVLYKALYSKEHNVPLSKINVEFFILKRKLYDESKVRYEQSRIQVFKPSSHQQDVLLVIQEFGKFVDTCFTAEGVHRIDAKYPKIPGKAKKNCKYCNYLKNGKCDGKADIIE
jgi:Holliday junction resolvase-like predicted endonuclease